jgi:hypothetical protein
MDNAVIVLAVRNAVSHGRLWGKAQVQAPRGADESSWNGEQLAP